MTQRLDGVREAARGLSLPSRHPSFRRAVCVDAHVRICAGCALQLMKLSLLKWRPRQSLARSCVPSLAWCPETATAKRRPGGLQAETAVNGNLAPKSIVVEVADPIP